jgi:hypothetical protein
MNQTSCIANSLICVSVSVLQLPPLNPGSERVAKSCIGLLEAVRMLFNLYLNGHEHKYVRHRIYVHDH